jgi:ABC-type uncharacterized transport system ATPase subunit
LNFAIEIEFEIMKKMSIKVQNISKSYKTLKAVDKVSFQVNEGDQMALEKLAFSEFLQRF